SASLSNFSCIDSLGSTVSRLSGNCGRATSISKNGECTFSTAFGSWSAPTRSAVGNTLSSCLSSGMLRHPANSHKVISQYPIYLPVIGKYFLQILRWHQSSPLLPVATGRHPGSVRSPASPSISCRPTSSSPTAYLAAGCSPTRRHLRPYSGSDRSCFFPEYVTLESDHVPVLTDLKN